MLTCKRFIEVAAVLACAACASQGMSGDGRPSSENGVGVITDPTGAAGDPMAAVPTTSPDGTVGSPVDPTAGSGATPGSGALPEDDGTVGDTSMAGMGGDAQPPAGEVSDGRPPCLNAPSEGVIIGDSYINWSTHTLPADLTAASGQTWRLYAVGGASMASGGIATLIPDQLEQAVVADPKIKMVLMNGGGNDVMIPAATWVGGADCKNRADAPSIQVCLDIVNMALDRATQGMLRMADLGIQDVVYFFYPEVPEGTVLGGLKPNAMLAYAQPLAQELCESAEAMTGGKLRCHFVDMVPVFAGHNPDWFYPTDIHPNPMGSKAMAQAIWSRMQTDCVGQTAGSACCAP